MGSSRVRSWRKRCYLEWPFNYYIFSIMASTAFLKVPQIARDILQDVFMNAATKAVEDGFREEGAGGQEPDQEDHLP